jgi:hypothetical protein
VEQRWRFLAKLRLKTHKLCCEDIHEYKGVGWSYNMIGKGALITWICSKYICPSSWSCRWGNRDD